MYRNHGYSHGKLFHDFATAVMIDKSCTWLTSMCSDHYLTTCFGAKPSLGPSSVALSALLLQEDR